MLRDPIASSEHVMPTRNVVLTARHEQIIEALVASGRYQNASEVLRDGLRLVEDREAREVAKLARLREAIRLGEADFEEGRYQEFESADALARYLRELSERVIAKAK
jgi:antitoxin ParD1/3/4